MKAPLVESRPSSLTAERTVLGALLLDADRIVDVAAVIGPDDFLDPVHADIYRAILGLYERRQSIDFVTVTEELREHRRINAIGGAAFLAQLVQEVPTSSHAQTYNEDCDDPTLTDFYLRKNRNGPTGHIELKFNAARMSFLQ